MLNRYFLAAALDLSLAAAVRGAPTHQDVVELSPATTAPIAVTAAKKSADAPLISPIVFETSWQDATADEKTAFLEANPEIREKIQLKWERTSPSQRKSLLKKYALGNRPLKHKWQDATPEEKIAFLGTEPEVRQRLKENWELLTQDQRLQLVRRRPSIARRALHHSWADATPEEKAAFLESQLDLRKILEKAWSLAAGSASTYKSWDQAAPGEHSQFIRDISAALDAARLRWDQSDPMVRTHSIRKWVGWKLKPAEPAPAAHSPAASGSAKKSAKAAKAKK